MLCTPICIARTSTMFMSTRHENEAQPTWCTQWKCRRHGIRMESADSFSSMVSGCALHSSPLEMRLLQWKVGQLNETFHIQPSIRLSGAVLSGQREAVLWKGVYSCPHAQHFPLKTYGIHKIGYPGQHLTENNGCANRWTFIAKRTVKKIAAPTKPSQEMYFSEFLLVLYIDYPQRWWQYRSK